MMNFLPTEDKKDIKKEYFRRLLVFAGLFSFLAVSVGAILLLSPLVFLKNQKDNLSNQLFFSEERISRENIENVIPLVEDLNRKIPLINSGVKEVVEKSSFVKVILDEKTSDIKISEFLLDNEKISIRGLSGSRQSLINFTEALRGKKDFKKVESPVSNLIKDKDIDFTLSIEL